MHHHQSRARKSGFTVVEIVVVMAIVALISSIVFSAFKSVREGNKKSSCQANMAQIYQALRLYGQDFNGDFPSFNPGGLVKGTTDNPRAANGLGLWALYAYPASNNLDCDGRTTQLPVTETPDNNTPPLASYIKSPKIFHCPFDDFDNSPVPSDGCKVAANTKLNSSQMTFTDTDNQKRFNPFYNSYQTADVFQGGDALNQAPYSSFREAGSSRQLVYYKSQAAPSEINSQRRAPDTTILTWCRFHRKTDREGLTVDRASNSDNVLFMDGTVQYIATKQDIGTAQCQAWTRAPIETVESLKAGNACPK